MITDEEWRLLEDGRLTIAQLLMTAPEPLKIVIAKALLMARDQALEEAASKIEKSVAPDIYEFINQRLQCIHDAGICRALKNGEK